jgi:hypothetical protein
MIKCLTAAVQVRVNVTFIHIAEESEFPMFSITSDRENIGANDTDNFKAFHVTGHVMAALAENHRVAKVVAIRGNCFSSITFDDSVAGQLNRQLSKSFSDEDRTNATKWTQSDEAAYCKGIITQVMDRFLARQTNGFKKLSPMVAQGTYIRFPAPQREEQTRYEEEEETRVGEEEKDPSKSLEAIAQERERLQKLLKEREDKKKKTPAKS